MTTTPSVTAQSPERFHGLDAARASALLLGIVLHATMSFFLFTPALDVSRSASLGVAFYVIHVFRMSLFYMIAGFFGHMVFHRRGARTFLKDRAKRIFVPMTVGWVVLAPPTIAAAIWGFTRSFPEMAQQGAAEGAAEGAGAAALTAQGFPLTHLWFLYYLCIFYVLMLALRWLFVSLDRGGRIRGGIDTVIRAVVPSYAAPILLAAPLFAVLYLDPTWAVWFGIPTPDTGFALQLPAIIGFGTAFAFGWLAHRQTGLLSKWREQWPVNLAVGAGLTAFCLMTVGLAPSMDPVAIEGPAWSRAVYAAGYTASIWFWTFGLIGAALRFCSGESPVRRYLADASYWLYLVHVPIVFALQVLMMNWPLHWTIKFPLILATTLTVLLVSYHYLVRPTLIGEILNGRRYPRRRRVAPGASVTPATPVTPIVPVASPAPVASSAPADPFAPPASIAPDAPVTPIVPRVPDAPGTPTVPLAPPAPVASIAQLGRVTKRYGKAMALDDLTLSVRPGELLAVLGPNGAGKSTAIGLWLGTLEPDDGAVTVMGGSPLDVQSRLGVGVMMQEVGLAPMLSARELITLTANYYRDPRSVEETIEMTGIEAIADKRFGAMSAGQKRQVQFAVAVCGRPELLFLDEPTVGLDVRAREAMWKAIRRLLKDGSSIVLTTHYLEEAEALADRVAVLVEGRLIAEGSVDEMRSLVSRKHITCESTLDLDEIRGWPGVVDVEREAHLVHITALEAEPVVRRLLEADSALKKLEVRQASLADAFTVLTGEAA